MRLIKVVLVLHQPTLTMSGCLVRLAYGEWKRTRFVSNRIRCFNRKALLQIVAMIRFDFSHRWKEAIGRMAQTTQQSNKNHLNRRHQCLPTKAVSYFQALQSITQRPTITGWLNIKDLRTHRLRRHRLKIIPRLLLKIRTHDEIYMLIITILLFCIVFTIISHLSPLNYSQELFSFLDHFSINLFFRTNEEQHTATYQSTELSIEIR